ncbi:MAG: hypothetical protein H6545_07020 [Bacteroidales bacterium]|nr:hypothetical protein [Bacteroidales bacterium]
MPFGCGPSYTTFDYSDLTSSQVMKMDGTLTVRAKVTKSCEMDADGDFLF